jgi:hypothetical protein
MKGSGLFHSNIGPDAKPFYSKTTYNERNWQRYHKDSGDYDAAYHYPGHKLKEHEELHKWCDDKEYLNIHYKHHPEHEREEACREYMKEIGYGGKKTRKLRTSKRKSKRRKQI